jgi:hypothetical protein
MRQLRVTNDAGFGILGSEFLQQLIQGVLLGFGASIFCFALGIETALIDNTEGTVVVMAGMDALDGLWQQGNDTAIVADIVVVGALAILGLAAGNEVLNAEGLVARVSHTVDDEELDGLQWFHFSNTDYTD